MIVFFYNSEFWRYHDRIHIRKISLEMRNAHHESSISASSAESSHRTAVEETSQKSCDKAECTRVHSNTGVAEVSKRSGLEHQYGTSNR